MKTIDFKNLKAGDTIYFTSENGLFESQKLTVFCNGIFWVKFEEKTRLRWNKKKNQMEMAIFSSEEGCEWKEIKGTIFLIDPVSDSNRIDYIKSNIDHIDPVILRTIYDIIKEYKPISILR